MLKTELFRRRDPISLKIALIGSILAAQCPSINAGNYNFDFRPGFAGVAVGGILSGALGTIALMKAYTWARHEQGVKKVAGRTFLGATSIGALLGLGYAAGYMNKR
jgi:hypothetical protein